jgi:HD-like signal output (HDOD) protein
MYGKAIDLLASGERTTIEAEEKIFELNHVEVGKWVAEKWRFPDSTVGAIAQHHQPWPAAPVGRKNMTLGLLIKAADTIAHAAGIGHPSHLRAFTRSFVDQLPQAFSQFSLSTEEGQRFIETFKQQFENEFGLYQLENH